MPTTVVCFALATLLQSATALKLNAVTSRRGVVGSVCLASAACVMPRSATASPGAKAALREASALREAAEAAAKSTPALLAEARADLENVVTILQTNQDWVAIRRLLVAKPGLGDVRAYARDRALADPSNAGAIASAKKIILEAIFVIDTKAYERQKEEILSYQVGPDKKIIDANELISSLKKALAAIDVIAK
jgi:hypothetical protein